VITASAAEGCADLRLHFGIGHSTWCPWAANAEEIALLYASGGESSGLRLIRSGERSGGAAKA
jgi:hypothetical protein